MRVVLPVQVSPGFLLGNRYRLDDWIAAGGMGAVWRATDLHLGRAVAVKLLHPGCAEHEQDLARFRAEARHAASLSDPAIAQVYDFYEPDPPVPPYLVMELIVGQPLDRLLAEGPLEPARTLDVIAQTARGLHAAHSAGLVHRDIKPGNLLVSKTGHVKITDFGIAYATGSVPLTRPGTLVGTPAYLAPERAAGAPATPAADLYALGVVAFQCLTGELPFSGPPLAVALAHRERPIPALPPWIPAGIAALVADLTARDPWARPSAAQVAQQAEHLRTTLDVAAAGPRRATQDGRAAGRPAYALLAAVAVALVAATGWALTGVHKPAPDRLRPAAPAASRPSSPRVTHPAHHAVPGMVSPTGAPVHGVPSAKSGNSSGPSGSPATTPVTAAPPPSSAPAPSGTPTPSGTTPATGTPAPSESPTPSATSTPSGTPTPTGTSASGTPTPPGGTPASAPPSSPEAANSAS